MTDPADLRADHLLARVVLARIAVLQVAKPHEGTRRAQRPWPGL